MGATTQPTDPDRSSLSSSSSSQRTTLRHLVHTARYLRPYTGIAAADILCAFASLGFYFVFPQVTQYIIDDIIAGNRMHLLLPVIAGLAGAFLLCNIFRALGIMLNARFEQNVIFDMRNDVYSRLLRLPVGYFDGRASGDLMTRVTDDITAVHRVLIDGTEQGATAIVSIVTVAAILLVKNAVLTMYALIPLGILVAGALWYTLSAHRRYRRQRQAIGEMNALLMDNLQGIRQIKAFGREEHENDRFAQRADALRRSTFGVMRVWAVYSPAMAFAGSLGMVLVLWVGGPLVTAGSMTVGQLVGFLFYLALFYEPIGKLHSLNQLVQSGRAAGERVFDILNATEEGERHGDGGSFDKPVSGEVRFEYVSFSYDGRREALKGVSLHARAGQMIALVGATGSGKTTLVNLLPAFYRPTSGRITVDSTDIAGVSLESLRALIGIVTQEAFLFNGTVRENILYGKPDASPQELESAARAANCHDFITRLPEGYDTRVGERGVKLSVGEKQRVSIARALLKDPPILILDEATASVDTATEKTIQEALQRLMANRTSFVIAHRLSTIVNADQILVLARGEIVERGTHEELLARGDVYAALCSIQNVDFLEEGYEKNNTAR